MNMHSEYNMVDEARLIVGCGTYIDMSHINQIETMTGAHRTRRPLM